MSTSDLIKAIFEDWSAPTRENNPTNRKLARECDGVALDDSAVIYPAPNTGKLPERCVVGKPHSLMPQPTAAERERADAVLREVLPNATVEEADALGTIMAEHLCVAAALKAARVAARRADHASDLPASYLSEVAIKETKRDRQGVIIGLGFPGSATSACVRLLEFTANDREHASLDDVTAWRLHCALATFGVRSGKRHGTRQRAEILAALLGGLAGRELSAEATRKRPAGFEARLRELVESQQPEPLPPFESPHLLDPTLRNLFGPQHLFDVGDF